jgi:hypothetical protein
MQEARSSAAGGGRGITRKSVLDGSFLKRVRSAAARIGTGIHIRTDEQIEFLATTFLAARPNTTENIRV